MTEIHVPEIRPLGCNGKYGDSGSRRHQRAGEPSCEKCTASSNHYRREVRRGRPRPRTLRPCGTRAAASRHRYNNEPLDFACRLAEARGEARRRAKKAVKKKSLDLCM
jgi:hypothetical protein